MSNSTQSTPESRYQEKQSAIIDDNGAFFAFNSQTLREKAQEGVQYANSYAGLVVPKDNKQRLESQIDEAHAQFVKEEIELYGIDKIILRELYNHEAFYTGDVEDTFYALQGYGVTIEKVLEVFNGQSH